MTPIILQAIDPTAVLQEAFKVNPDGGNGYGFALGILLLALFASAWLNRYQMKARDKDQEKREAQLEKAYSIMLTQNQHSERLEDGLAEVKTELKIHSNILQQIVSRP